MRVAYDITLLAELFDRHDALHGIARVYEELLFALSERSDIELTAVTLCHDDDILQQSVRAYSYFTARRPRIRGNFGISFRSRLGLTRCYQDVFAACQTEEMQGIVNRSISSILNRRARGFLYRLSYTYGIDRLQKSFDPGNYDVFHSAGLGLPPGSLTTSVPRVLTVYDLIPILAPQFVPPYQTEFQKRLIGTVDIHRDWVTCISEHTKAEFCEYTGMSPDRAFVTPLAASTAFRRVDDVDLVSATRQRYGVPEEDYFLTLAAPQPRKNLTHLIRCFFRLLEEQALNVNLVLAGSRDQGWMYDEIFEVAESSAKHRDRVIFTGFIHDEDLAALYSGALAFVFPSLYEGFGLPPLEAMQCGVPVITSNVTALPEVVNDAGIMVDPDDADALCQALLDMTRDAELRQRLGEKGVQRSREFTWERCADKTMEAYRAAVSERNRRERSA